MAMLTWSRLALNAAEIVEQIEWFPGISWYMENIACHGCLFGYETVLYLSKVHKNRCEHPAAYEI